MLSRCNRFVKRENAMAGRPVVTAPLETKGRAADKRGSRQSYGVISKATPQLYLPPAPVVPKMLPSLSRITP